MSSITETVAMGSSSHTLNMVVPERFCSADISSEGDHQALQAQRRDTVCVSRAHERMQSQSSEAHAHAATSGCMS